MQLMEGRRMYDRKWTIRGIDDNARQAMEEIHDNTGVPYGRLFSMALWEWIDGLDLEDPIPIVR
jgi:hypothetical protein